VTTPTVLVTGADGLVGRAVVQRLLETGHRVTALTLPGAAPQADVRTVVGDARDADVVRDAVRGADAVVHLAAIPHPFGHPAATVFGNNAVATFTVLWTAAEEGIRTFAIASSVNATGLLMNPSHPLPARYPIDETTPAELADPYSLSKAVDEMILDAVTRRFDACGIALRLPLILSPDNAEGLREWQAERPREGAGDGWAWLDARDGAEAFRLAIELREPGAHVLHVAAPETIQPIPTEDLISRHAPNVPRERSFPGFDAPVDTSRARSLLGFVPQHLELGRPA